MGPDSDGLEFCLVTPGLCGASGQGKGLVECFQLMQHGSCNIGPMASGPFINIQLNLFHNLMPHMVHREKSKT